MPHPMLTPIANLTLAAPLPAAGPTPAGAATVLLAGLCGLVVGLVGATAMARRSRLATGRHIADSMHACLQRLGLPVGADREPIGWAEALERLTGRVESRLDELRNERRDLLRQIEAVADPVLITDTGGAVLVANAAAAETLGRPSEDVHASRIDELFTQSALLRLHGRAARGELGTRQFRMTVADTTRVFEAVAAPITASGGGRRVVLTLRDVTELATAVQLKTDFVANASHELRTPLASIKTAAETLADLEPGDESMRERLVNLIGANTNRLELLIADLLDLARLESPELRVETRTFDADEIRSTLEPMFERVCQERSLELRFEVDARVRTLHTDPKLLLISIKNLIENATKFAYENTAIRVVVKPIDFGEDLPGVRFRVIDQGIGIPLTEQQRVFERFYQVDTSRAGHPKKRGTGLGLAIVKHAMRALGGSVGVESVWKEGTTMIIDLPGAWSPAELDQSGDTPG